MATGVLVWPPEKEGPLAGGISFDGIKGGSAGCSCGCGRQHGSTRLRPVRRDEPVAASLGRSPAGRRRWPYAAPSWGLVRSVGRWARPPSSGRSTRQRRTVKRSRRAPGATRRVPSGRQASGWHPEHGEAGRGQRLIVHTRQEHPADPLSIPSKGMPARRGPFFPFPRSSWAVRRTLGKATSGRRSPKTRRAYSATGHWKADPWAGGFPGCSR
jgi:hypothetical protein